ncbi:MAG: prolyl oligopeptidase family serine peptidase [Chitinivibrionales bacterium]|nr:prolyl oligopeptidase family serine peptidase [Chitinivibrionales bacterium]
MRLSTNRTHVVRPGSRGAVWAVCLAALLLGASCRNGGSGEPAGAGQEIEFTYRNSFNGTQQRAAGYVPAAAGSGEPLPLLVYAHWFGGNRMAARDAGYYEECAARGWLCACPQLHGEKTVDRQAWGSRESQHDLIDVIEYMRRHYRVDSTRIYLAGRSMGGMAAQLMAAKHPDVFAAVVAGQGISDLDAWFAWGTSLQSFVEQFGVRKPYVEENAFAYARRSSVHYGPNFRYVPLYLWHGTNDQIVPVGQTEALYDTITRYSRWHPEPFWFVAAPHGGAAMPASWVCDRLSPHYRMSESGHKVAGRFYPELTLVTDEDKEFFWLGLHRADTSDFGRISAALEGDSLIVVASNLDTVTVYTDRLAAGRGVRAFRAEFEGADGVIALAHAAGVLRQVAVGRRKSGTFESE